MEFTNNGDLFQKISDYKNKGQYIKEEEIWSIFIQVCLFLTGGERLKSSASSQHFSQRCKECKRIFA